MTISFSVDVGGNKSADIQSTAPLCIELCFSGPAGDLGCEILELPATAAVPAGATEWKATVVDCPGGESTGGVSVAGAGGQARFAVPVNEFVMLGGPITPIADGTTNVSYTFVVRAATQTLAEARRDMVLAGGIGTPVGADLDVIYYNETRAEFDALGLPTGVRMKQAEVGDTFLSYALDVNGVTFAQLGGPAILHYAVQAWDVVETFVPTSAFDTSPGAFDNTARADWTTLETTIPWTAWEHVFAD